MRCGLTLTLARSLPAGVGGGWGGKSTGLELVDALSESESGLRLSSLLIEVSYSLSQGSSG